MSNPPSSGEGTPVVRRNSKQGDSTDAKERAPNDGEGDNSAARDSEPISSSSSSPSTAAVAVAVTGTRGEDKEKVNDTSIVPEGNGVATASPSAPEVVMRPHSDTAPLSSAAEALVVIRDFISQKGDEQFFFKVFKMLDVDGSGLLDKKEFLKGLRAIHLNMNNENFQLLVTMFDSDNSGKVSLKEFFETVKESSKQKAGLESERENAPRKKSDPKPPKVKSITANEAIAFIRNSVATGNMREHFKAWDLDGSGYVTRQEFALGFQKLNCEVSEKVLDEIIKRLDKSNLGCVNYSNFSKNLLEDDITSGNYDPFTFHRSVKPPPHGALPLHNDFTVLSNSENKEFLARISKSRIGVSLPQTFSGCRRLFLKIDKDNDEYISRAELENYFKSAKTCDVSDEDIDKLTGLCDANEDGFIQCKDLFLTLKELVPEYKTIDNRPASMKDGGSVRDTSSARRGSADSALKRFNVRDLFKGTSEALSSRFGLTPREDTFHIVKPGAKPKYTKSKSFPNPAMQSQTYENDSKLPSAIVGTPSDMTSATPSVYSAMTAAEKDKKKAVQKFHSHRLAEYLGRINNLSFRSQKKDEDLEQQRIATKRDQVARYNHAIAMESSQVKLLVKQDDRKTRSQWSFTTM